MSAQVAADLRAAAEVLERDGWKQGSYHGSDGCHCALGAIAVAVSMAKAPNPENWQLNGDREYRFRTASAAGALLVSGAPFGSELARWNDGDGRTATEVIAALRRAADKADES